MVGAKVISHGGEVGARPSFGREVWAAAGAWSLTEALTKPLHRFNDQELHGLVLELEGSGYPDRERAVASLTAEICEYVSRDRLSQADRLYGARPHVAVCPVFTNPQTTRDYKRIHVTIPEWLPDEYVKPFVERMIRDQIEEG